MKSAFVPENSKVNEENSTVRQRTPSAPSLSPELGPMSREARMDQKLLEAEALLNELPRTDSRRRLLSAAIMRGDEALLNAILSTLNSER